MPADRRCPGRDEWAPLEKEIAMCASCGCAEPYQRHQKGDITIDDVKAAGADRGLSPEQVAENIVKAVARDADPTLA
ncbi:MAG: hypothetical protein ACYDC5_10780 [Candidatus Dormibacteria bacterium]